MRNCDFIEGVNIIAKYLTDHQKENFDLHATHDQIWFCEYTIIPYGEDQDRLIKLGWFVDQGGWSCFC